MMLFEQMAGLTLAIIKEALSIVRRTPVPGLLVICTIGLNRATLRTDMKITTFGLYSEREQPTTNLHGPLGIKRELTPCSTIRR